MANELHHQSLNKMILERPNSQRVVRLLREMQLSGADDVVGNFHVVHGFAIAGMTVALAAGIVAIPGEVRGMDPQTRSPLHTPVQPQEMNAEGGRAVKPDPAQTWPLGTLPPSQELQELQATVQR